MNKYIIKAALCSMLAVPVLSSCEFDQYPEGSLPTEKSWETVNDATNYNNGLLAALRSVASSTSCTIVPEVQADLFNATTYNGNPPYPTMHSWLFTSSSGDGIWSGGYSLISNANNVINNIDKIQVADGSEDQALLQTYKGVAYFARAYAYTQIASYYCKNYDPATASTTLGLPIVTDVDVSNKPSRSSLADTYQFIKDDIAKAKECFTNHDETDYTAPNYNVTRALEARVSLFTQDYDNAITCAKELIDKYPLITNSSDFANMWTNDDGSEIIYEPQQTADERIDTYGDLIHQVQVGDEVKYTASYIPSQTLIDLYGKGDYRADTYFAQVGVYTGQQEDANGYVLSKFPGNPALKKGTGISEFYNMTKAFRVAEMYLIAAEAQYRKDGTGASYLNTLRTARGASKLTNTSGADLTGDALFSEIKNEWAREMCGEGMRLLCLKRWNEGFTRMTPQSLTEGVIYLLNNVTTLKVNADNMRWVWEIPSNDLVTNTNLERNWPTE